MRSSDEHPDASPLLETSDLPGGGNPDDEEELQEEKEIPPFTNHIKRVKYWLEQFRYPLFLVLANLVFHLIIRWGCYYLRIGSDFRKIPTDDDGIDANQSALHRLRLLLTAAFLMYLLMFLVDAYICFRSCVYWQLRMEDAYQQKRGQTEQAEYQPVNTNTAENQNTGTETTEDMLDKPFDFVAMSRKVDSLFGANLRENEPQSTFLVGLLYLLFALSVWGATAAGASVVYFQVEPCLRNASRCYNGGFWSPYDDYYYSGEDMGISSLQHEKNFTNLPLPVQNWIKAEEGTDMIPYNKTSAHETDSPTLGYVQVADGSLAFSYSRQINQTASESGVAVLSPGEIAEYKSSTLENDHQHSYRNGDNLNFDLLGIPKIPPYHGWCGVFGLRKIDIVFQEVICYREGNITGHFPEVTDGGKDMGGSLNPPKYFVTEDTLWVTHHQDISFFVMNRHETTRKMHLSVVSYNISTMERKVKLEKTLTDTSVHTVFVGARRELKLRAVCRSWHSTVCWPSLATLMILSAVLYRSDISSCTVPASIVLCLLSNSFLTGIWSSVMVWLGACVCTFLMLFHKTQAPRPSNYLWKYMSLDMLIWADYTLLACIVLKVYTTLKWLFWHDTLRSILDAALPLLLTALLVVTNALVLNHPVFEMLGCIFVILAVATIPAFLGRGPVYLLLPCVCLVLSFGCFAMGRCCRYYQLHARVYCRRGWQQWKKSRRR